MRALDLLARGFQSGGSFAPTVTARPGPTLPTAPGVYAILTAETGSQSDIAYIGCAANQRGLAGRIQQYYSPGPTQQTNHRIRAAVHGLPVCALIFKVTAGPSEAHLLEAELLQEFVQVHGCLPRLNRAMPAAAGAGSAQVAAASAWESLATFIDSGQGGPRHVTAPPNDGLDEALVQMQEGADLQAEADLEEEYDRETLADNAWADEGSECDDYDSDGARFDDVEDPE